MPFHQLVIDIGPADPGPGETACFALGALSVSLADAADHPVLEPAPGETPLWPEIRMRAPYPADAEPRIVAATLMAVLALPAEAIRIEEVEDRVWEREWLKDFRPMRFGRRLWVCPDGQRPRESGSIILELDPGLAFGTGTHATTAMCLEWLDGFPLAGFKVLDYGCGSGILAHAVTGSRIGSRSALPASCRPDLSTWCSQTSSRVRCGDWRPTWPGSAVPEAGCCWRACSTRRWRKWRMPMVRGLISKRRPDMTDGPPSPATGARSRRVHPMP